MSLQAVAGEVAVVESLLSGLDRAGNSFHFPGPAGGPGFSKNIRHLKRSCKILSPHLECTDFYYRPYLRVGTTAARYDPWQP